MLVLGKRFELPFRTLAGSFSQQQHSRSLIARFTSQSLVLKIQITIIGDELIAFDMTSVSGSCKTQSIFGCTAQISQIVCIRNYSYGKKIC